MEELGSGGFMGIGDAQPGMRVVLVAKNGAQAAGTEFHGEVFESQSDGVLVKIKPEAGKTIEIKKKDITYELQICVNNALYTWEDVSVSAASNAGANSYRIAVATNPKVINRRKYPRMPVANACTVTLKKSGKAYNGRMINISAGGFAFSAHQEDFANAIGQDILLEIPTSRWRRHGRWTDISSAVRIMTVSSLSDAVCRRTAKRSRLMSIKITGNREEFV